MTNKPLFSTSLLTHLLSFLLLVVHLTPVTVAQNEDEIVADETEQLPLGESVAFWLIFICVIWLWSFGRQVAIHGLDFVIRQPSTLVFIMIIMYVIAWGLVELSMSAAGGYDPAMRKFGSGDGDSFTRALVIFSVLVTLFMWLMCSKCADKYSTFSQQKKADAAKAKNPYADRGDEMKPLSSFVSAVFCTCGTKGMEMDGIDAEEAEKKTGALQLVPPPPPVDEKEYQNNQVKLKEYKEETKKIHDNNLGTKLMHNIKVTAHDMHHIEEHAKKALHNAELAVEVRAQEQLEKIGKI